MRSDLGVTEISVRCVQHANCSKRRGRSVGAITHALPTPPKPAHAKSPPPISHNLTVTKLQTKTTTKRDTPTTTTHTF